MRTHQDPSQRLLLIALVGLGLGLTPTTASAQAPTPAPAQAPAEPSPALADDATDQPFVDLTNRYRFIERYAVTDEQAAAGAIGSYQVAIKETTRHWPDLADEAAKPIPSDRVTVYAEHAAGPSSLGGVAATIRRYRRSDLRPVDPNHAANPPIDGLTIWYQPRWNEAPLILSLTDGRSLSERDFEVASRQAFLPGLSAMLPAFAVRVGDNWRVPRKALQAMVGDTGLRSDAVIGKFLELRRDDASKTTRAVMSIAGRLSSTFGDSNINARLIFSFPTPAATPTPAAVKADEPGTKPAPGVGKRDEALVRAVGAISEIRLAGISTGPVPGGAKGQRFRTAREIVLERKLGLEPGADPIRLVTAPELTDANSWLTHHDPKGRFTFQHPQSLLAAERYQFAAAPETEAILLVKSQAGGRDLVRIEAFAKEQTPEALKDRLSKQWAKMQVEVLPGVEEWLPETDWPGMKVYRIEAALKLASRNPRGSRLHYDAYLVKLGIDADFTVVATTTRDVVVGFRRDVERMIKTFRLVAPKPAS